MPRNICKSPQGGLEMTSPSWAGSARWRSWRTCRSSSSRCCRSCRCWMKSLWEIQVALSAHCWRSAPGVLQTKVPRDVLEWAFLPSLVLSFHLRSLLFFPQRSQNPQQSFPSRSQRSHLRYPSSNFLSISTIWVFLSFQNLAFLFPVECFSERFHIFGWYPLSGTQLIFTKPSVWFLPQRIFVSIYFAFLQIFQTCCLLQSTFLRGGPMLDGVWK